MIKRLIKPSLIATSLLLPLSSVADIVVVGLFKNAAALQIDGQQRMLRAGDLSPEGVRVISATPKQVVIERDGQRQVLGLSQHISSSYSTAQQAEVTIPRSANNQYITQGHINGRQIEMLVDTGANLVAMSEVHARRLGIDYRRHGLVGKVQTASGLANAYGVSLKSISIGGITANAVEATVIEGDYPAMVLLGVSFLKHVDLREQNGAMYLKAKY